MQIAVPRIQSTVRRLLFQSLSTCTIRAMGASVENGINYLVSHVEFLHRVMLSPRARACEHVKLTALSDHDNDKALPAY